MLICFRSNEMLVDYGQQNHTHTYIYIYFEWNIRKKCSKAGVQLQ